MIDAGAILNSYHVNLVFRLIAAPSVSPLRARSDVLWIYRTMVSKRRRTHLGGSVPRV